MDGDPTCSPDGSSVAYVRFVSRGLTEIWVYPFGQPELERRLTRGRDPSFSPDGKWIVYSQRVADIPRLWRIRPDGAGRTRVGRVGGKLRESGPSVAPDGSMLVYESVRKHRHRLFLRRLDGSGDSVLLSTGDGLHAVW
jgi:Tol biopolymer transport system component